VRTVRRSNPRRRGGAILVASRAGTVLQFDGRNFSSKGRAKLFPTMLAAYARGERLLRQHRSVLRAYKLYVRKA